MISEAIGGFWTAGDISLFPVDQFHYFNKNNKGKGECIKTFIKFLQ